MRWLVSVFAAVILVGVDRSEANIFIDYLPSTGGIGNVGEHTSFLDGVSSYYAQSFVASTSEPVFAEELVFSMRSDGGPLDFRVLLTETSGGTEAINPRDITPTVIDMLPSRPLNY